VRRMFESIGKVVKFNEDHKFIFRLYARACVLVDTDKELPIKEEIIVEGKVV